uniref:Choline transporter-like protein n=1 Tax=Plectus sambesii TaxID=2011161 RepID=A0A914XEE5_9BILA
MGCCCSSGKDPSLRPDPHRPRECTDIPACGLFFLFWCVMIFIAIFSALQGDLFRLIYGTDSFGNTCGRANDPLVSSNNSHLSLPLSGMDMRHKTFLFPMDVRRPFETVWICVQECPPKTMVYTSDLVEYGRGGGNYLCSYDVPLRNYTHTDLHWSSNIGPCPVMPVMRSTPILNRCVPTDFLEIGHDIMSKIFGFLNDADLFKQVLSDIVIVRHDILLFCILAFIISLVVVFVMRFVAGIVVYLIFILVLLAAAGITAALWYGWWTLKMSLDHKELTTNGTQLLIMETKNEHTILIYAIAASVVSAILMAVICCLFRSAGLVVDLFREAGRALQAMPMLLIQPLFTFIALMIFFIYWSLVVLLLATSTHAVPVKQSALPPAPYFEQTVVVYNATAAIRYMWWWHAVGLIWTAEFLLACQQMVVAGSVAAWYFSRDRSRVRFPICHAIKQLICYHLGSVALGSLIITIVKVPRLILMYIQAKLTGSTNLIAKYVLKCLICCLYCVEKCLRYLHHNAYTIIAIEGRSFCPAAAQAFGILASNATDVATINTVGDFVLFLGKCGVAALTGLVASLRFRDNPQLHYWAIPLLMVCIFAYFIAHCFLSVYEMVIDTLFLCYAEDKDYSARTGEEEFTDAHFKDYMNDTIQRERRLYGDTYRYQGPVDL